MAEALLAEALRERQEIRLASAGLGALVGYPADAIAQELLRQHHGLDISAHRARQLTPVLTRHADLILVMETEHKRLVEAMDASARGKIYRLGEWSGFDIPDPYRQPHPVFFNALELIQQGVTDWRAKLKT